MPHSLPLILDNDLGLLCMTLRLTKKNSCAKLLKSINEWWSYILGTTKCSPFRPFTPADCELYPWDIANDKFPCQEKKLYRIISKPINVQCSYTLDTTKCSLFTFDPRSWPWPLRADKQDGRRPWTAHLRKLEQNAKCCHLHYYDLALNYFLALSHL